MVNRQRTRLWFVLLPVIFGLAACASTPSASTPAATKAAASSVQVFMTLSPVPLRIRVNSSVSPFMWVGPLTGPYIDALAPTAAVQIHYIYGTPDKPMIANLFWFTASRFDELMMSPDAPKGTTLGTQGDHVLFLQTSLEMPFDPQSKHANRFAEIVGMVSDVARYAMSNSNLTLERR
jgi:hypothetical protein